MPPGMCVCSREVLGPPVTGCPILPPLDRAGAVTPAFVPTGLALLSALLVGMDETGGGGGAEDGSGYCCGC